MSEPRKMRKKPVVITAMQWRGPEDDSELYRFIPGNKFCVSSDGHPCISTLEGLMRAEKGDWIIQGVKGEFYPCKPDIFDATYEEVQ